MNKLRPTWYKKTFSELSVAELYELLALRVSVFIVEQNCPYRETDGKDLQAIHVMGYLGKNLVACSRIVMPGISYKEVSIGRVATALNYRGTGLGKELMNETLHVVKARFGNVPLRISAQIYLIPFYKSFGFETAGDEYLEDNMPHIEMYLAAGN